MSEQPKEGPWLDAFIAEIVMGWPSMGSDEPYRLYKQHGGVIVDGRPAKFPEVPKGATIPSPWKPSTNLADAIDVAEQLRENGWLVVMKWMPKEFYFRIGGGLSSEYDGPQPPVRQTLRGKTVVDLHWMRKEDWPYVPVPSIIEAKTPALAICRAAFEATKAIEAKKREKAEAQ